MYIVKVAFKAIIFLPFAHRMCTMPRVPIFVKNQGHIRDQPRTKAQQPAEVHAQNVIYH